MKKVKFKLKIFFIINYSNTMWKINSLKKFWSLIHVSFHYQIFLAKFIKRKIRKWVFVSYVASLVLGNEPQSMLIPVHLDKILDWSISLFVILFWRLVRVRDESFAFLFFLWLQFCHLYSLPFTISLYQNNRSTFLKKLVSSNLFSNNRKQKIIFSIISPLNFL